MLTGSISWCEIIGQGISAFSVQNPGQLGELDVVQIGWSRVQLGQWIIGEMKGS